MIYHLVWRSDWDTHTDGRFYRPESLRSEGFVHCTREPSKLIEVANLFFPPRDDELLLLALNESKAGSPIKDEDPGVGHLFPHVYGPIALAAVLSVRTMIRSDSTWQLPVES